MERRLTSCGVSNGFGSPSRPAKVAAAILAPAGKDLKSLQTALDTENPHGGAPGFRLENVWVLPGLPSEMEAMFDAYADQLRGEVPISAWRRAYRTRESEIVQLLTGATVRWPQVMIGSYPRFLPDGPEVEVVLKSADSAALAAAVAWLEPALDDVARG